MGGTTSASLPAQSQSGDLVSSPLLCDLRGERGVKKGSTTSTRAQISPTSAHQNNKQTGCPEAQTSNGTCKALVLSGRDNSGGSETKFPTKFAEAFNATGQLFLDLGLQTSPAKAVSLTSMVFLGFFFNTVDMNNTCHPRPFV